MSPKRESKSVEFKERFTPTNRAQALEVLKDIVAIANSGGGTLAIGINNAGESCGSDVNPVLDYDHAKYWDLIKKYTMQDFADFELIEAKKDGRSVAVFLINPHDFRLVFERPGTYSMGKNQQGRAFSQGTIYFRHGGKSECGTTDDLRKFIGQRVREMQNLLVKGMRRVSEAPRGSQLQIVSRGTARTESAGAVAVKMTRNPDAQGVIPVDRHEISPYRQKEVVERLKKILPEAIALNTYDLQAINKVHKISEEKDLSWQPDFSSRQYSEAFIERLVDKVSNKKKFLKKTRRRFPEMNRKEKINKMEP